MAETISLTENDKRLEQISEQLINFANGDFGHELMISDKRDNIDSIIVGLNLLGEELKSNIDLATRRQMQVNQAFDRLNEAQHLALIGSWEWDVFENKIEWTDQLYRLYGLERNSFETSFENYLNLIHPDDKIAVNEVIQKAYVNHQPFEFFHRIIRTDGSLRVIHSRGEVFTNTKGETVKMTGTAQDVTSLKESEERLLKYTQQLEYKNKETQQFTYIASHDLQEPLRTITNYIGLLSSDYKGKLEGNADIYIQFITNGANRMQTLISDLLEYTRLENDTVVEKIDCNKIMGDVLDSMQATINQTKTSVNVHQLPVIDGQRTRLTSLFQNLISNAIKFRKKDVDPVLEVKAIDIGNSWLFSFQDNGIGIEKEYFDKIFMLFQRLHPRKQYEGTGIGLAQCKKIVELSGGKIWVESTFGEGSVFYVSIPKKIIV